MSRLGGASGRESASRRSASAACISLGAALARLVAERVLGAEHERDAEQPLHHALVQLAGEVDARLEQARAALLARRDADARRQRGGLAERPHRVALVVGELEAGAAAVGEDHAEPAAAGGHRRAGERLDAAEARVALGHPALEVAGDLHDAVLREGHLGDRRLLERPVDLREQARARARGCPPAPRAGGRRRRAAARRAPSRPRGSTPRRGGRRTRAPRGRARRPWRRAARRSRRARRCAARGPGRRPSPPLLATGYACSSESRSVCSEVSETSRT